MQDNTQNAQVQEAPAKKTHPRREELKALSAAAKIAVRTGAAASVNEYLLDFYEKQEGEGTEFHTLREWNRKGYFVKKGSTAFLIWGKPKKQEEAQQEHKAEQEEDSRFFPVCYLFSSNQVQPRTPKTA